MNVRDQSKKEVSVVWSRLLLAGGIIVDSWYNLCGMMEGRRRVVLDSGDQAWDITQHAG